MLQLLFLGVPGDLEDLHPVAQRRRNRVEHVRRRDEQHLGQIERHVEVVIAERVVLLGVEHLEERRRRIAAEIRPELVDLVEDEHRVLRLRPAQPLHDLARQRADVRAPVSADLGLVAHPAERHADELPVERLRDRLGQRRLAHAGRADEAEDRALDGRVELPHGQVLEDAILGFLEARVVGVEDALGQRQVDDLVGALVPGQRDEPVEIGARHRVFGRGHGHLRQAIELAERLFLHQLGHARRLDLLGELFVLLGLIVALAELLLNRLHLLAQEVLALVLADFRLHLRLNLRPELEDLELLDEDPVQVVHPCADVERLEHLLLHRRADRGKRRRDEVGQAAGLGDVDGERLQVVGQQRRQRDDLLEVRLDVARERVDLQPIRVGRVFDGGRDTGPQVGMRRHQLVEREPREALDDQAQAAVGQLEHLVDVRRGADGIQIGLERLFDRGVALREHGDQLAVRDRVVDQADRALARHGQRHERIRKEHRVAQREDRQLGRNRERPIAVRQVLGLEGLELVAHGRPHFNVKRPYARGDRRWRGKRGSATGGAP